MVSSIDNLLMILITINLRFWRLVCIVVFAILFTNYGRLCGKFRIFISWTRNSSDSTLSVTATIITSIDGLSHREAHKSVRFI